MIFPSHHEYVTTHEYNVVVDYRNHGGRLIFLSANNFFWRITRRGNVMTRIKRWRDLGRPEAALIGIEYFHNDRGEHRAPWVVEKSSAADWLLANVWARMAGQPAAEKSLPRTPQGLWHRHRLATGTL